MEAALIIILCLVFIVFDHAYTKSLMKRIEKASFRIGAAYCYKAILDIRYKDSKTLGELIDLAAQIRTEEELLGKNQITIMEDKPL